MKWRDDFTEAEYKAFMQSVKDGDQESYDELYGDVSGQGDDMDDFYKNDLEIFEQIRGN